MYLLHEVRFVEPLFDFDVMWSDTLLAVRSSVV